MWKLDFDQLFENYSNSLKWYEHGTLAALVYGDVSRWEITNVLFSCLSDVDSALNLLRFIECSLPSNITFLGALSLIGAEYPFDMNSLAVFVENFQSFILLHADKNSLELRDVSSILKLNKEIDLRPSRTTQSRGLIIRTSLQLSVNISVTGQENFVEIDNAFLAEVDKIESMCFAFSPNGLILGQNETIDTRRLHEEMLQMSRCIPSGGRKFVNFSPLVPVVKDTHTVVPKVVPIVKVRKGLAKYCNVRAEITALAEIQPFNTANDITVFLRRGLKRAVFLAKRCLCDFASISPEHLININCGVFLVNSGLLLVVSPRIQDETVLRNYRIRLHRIFNLPSVRPLLKSSQLLNFNPEARKLLQNPHLHIKSYKPKGEVYVVNGLYNYHHYMQDGIDDSGWGCAYRSFQTIWSWFVLQGYVDKPVPTHREIQQSLYECGDKHAKFVGSHQWIGSLELSYCLENLAGIKSRILTTNSGAEVTENTRHLAQHFKTYGTPVMIGGGMLAHTILGVDFNESTGESSFLVLDPHYTGEEDLYTVVTRGWCGWKTSSFWKQDYFYNLLLPITPENVM